MTEVAGISTKGKEAANSGTFGDGVNSNGTAGNGAAGNGTAGNGTVGNETAGNGTVSNETAGYRTAGNDGNMTKGNITAHNKTAGYGTASNGTAGNETAGYGTASNGTDGIGIDFNETAHDVTDENGALINAAHNKTLENNEARIRSSDYAKAIAIIEAAALQGVMKTAANPSINTILNKTSDNIRKTNTTIKAARSLAKKKETDEGETLGKGADGNETFINTTTTDIGTAAHKVADNSAARIRAKDYATAIAIIEATALRDVMENASYPAADRKHVVQSETATSVEGNITSIGAGGFLRNGEETSANKTIVTGTDGIRPSDYTKGIAK